MVDPFFRPETIGCPYPHYADLRSSDPVHKLPDDDVFLVSRYAECAFVLSHPELFSSKAGPGLRQDSQLSTAGGRGGYRVVRTLLTNDPPSHTRFRRLVAQAFSARRVAQLEPSVRKVAGELIANFDPVGTTDFVRDFARPLPLTVIANFLGVPMRDRDAFERWSEDAAEVLGGQLTHERARECHDSLQQLLGYFEAELDKRRAMPRDDFLTVLLTAATDDEAELTTEEILAISYVTLVAGNETTMNLMSSLMLLLLRRPDLMQRVRSDRSLIPAAVEEALRLEAPVQGYVRRATRAVELDGVTIPSGSRVLVLAGSANHEEAQFPSPDEMDLDRVNARPHMSFGHGIHFCLGAALSRLEAAVALEGLLETCESIELVDGFRPQYQDNAVLRSLTSLPVRIRRK